MITEKKGKIEERRRAVKYEKFKLYLIVIVLRYIYIYYNRENENILNARKC